MLGIILRVQEGKITVRPWRKQIKIVVIVERLLRVNTSWQWFTQRSFLCVTYFTSVEYGRNPSGLMQYQWPEGFLP